MSTMTSMPMTLTQADELAAEIVRHGERLNQLVAKVQLAGVLATPEILDEIEGLMLDLGMPCGEMLVAHTFCDGLYIREGNMPSNHLIMGQNHRHGHHCVILKGRMIWLNAEGGPRELAAPCAFTAKPGRKLLRIVDEVVMQNVYATAGWPDECFRDVAKMEEHIYDLTDKYREHLAQHGPAQKTVINV